MPKASTAFALPTRLAAKAVPTLIDDDERQFAAIQGSLDRSIAELSERLDVERRAPGGRGQSALERDLEIHRLTSRLRGLRRFGLDLCLGRIVRADGDGPLYIGRLGLPDADGAPLLVDWRSPAAEPFFGATRAHPMGVVTRRRYRWAGGRVVDYWDEAFAEDGFDSTAALDDESAFIASLGATRSSRMRDVLGTIQADQDAIIRAGSRGALVVDGGPGTGKTVVALHRTAYLLYSDPRLNRRSGEVLFVGPHQAYLAYVEDVLPNLGEDGVQICTLRDFVEEGSAAGRETDPEVARLKSSARLVGAVEAAVRHYERPPSVSLTVETPWADLRFGPGEWAEAFESADSGVPHNDAREQIWDAIIDILADQVDSEEVPEVLLRRTLVHDEALTAAFSRAWPVLDPIGIVADLWSVPAYLMLCAPWLTETEVRLLQRSDPRTWTVADLPFLDAARRRVGDPKAGPVRRRREAAIAADREQMARVVDDLIAADDSELLLMSMLRGQDFQNSLVDEAALPALDPDRLGGPFAHIVVDEAQELTDAEWQMLLLRCPSHSFTIVGDRAQARHGFPESWEERLRRIGVAGAAVVSLTINYRTPREVMVDAEPVIRAALPDANVPISVRESGIPVYRGRTEELTGILADWLADHGEGVACVISADGVEDGRLPQTLRIRYLTPELSKGLEFDLVVLLDPDAFGDGVAGAVDRYVAMTRTTQRLVILTSGSTS